MLRRRTRINVACLWSPLFIPPFLTPPPPMPNGRVASLTPLATYPPDRISTLPRRTNRRSRLPLLHTRYRRPIHGEAPASACRRNAYVATARSVGICRRQLLSPNVSCYHRPYSRKGKPLVYQPRAFQRCYEKIEVNDCYPTFSAWFPER